MSQDAVSDRKCLPFLNPSHYSLNSTARKFLPFRAQASVVLLKSLVKLWMVSSYCVSLGEDANWLSAGAAQA